MPKPRPTTNLEYRPRPSRWYKDEHAKDEQQLAVIALTIMIGGLIILALHYSGTFETIMYKAANIISFII